MCKHKCLAFWIFYILTYSIHFSPSAIHSLCRVCLCAMCVLSDIHFNVAISPCRDVCACVCVSGRLHWVNKWDLLWKSRAGSVMSRSLAQPCTLLPSLLLLYLYSILCSFYTTVALLCFHPFYEYIYNATTTTHQKLPSRHFFPRYLIILNIPLSCYLKVNLGFL